MTELANEWRCLQQQYEDYEKLSLGIKLLNVLITLLLLVLPNTLAIVLVAVLYIQDAIIKTMQSRMADRLLVIEQAIKNGPEQGAYQLYSQWQINRAGVVGLLSEYCKHCAKPTVAFPHLILLALLVFQQL